MVSSFVDATTRDRSDFRKIAAPNTLLPFATAAVVRGRMEAVIVSSSAGRSVSAGCGFDIVLCAMGEAR